MRHLNQGKALSRNSSHRKAMFSNLTAALIKHGLVRTTLIKAKELRRYIEPLITLAREDSVAHRRQAFNFLRDDAAVGKLFKVLAPRYQKRPGGYTRIIKCADRAGDSAKMAWMELVDRVDETASTVQS